MFANKLDFEHKDLWLNGICLKIVPGLSNSEQEEPKKGVLKEILEDWKQVFGKTTNNIGIITAQMVHEQLGKNAESKLWLAWLYFCTKWEKLSSNSNQLVFSFPDLKRAQFVSVTQAIINSELFEKLIFRFVSVENSLVDADLQKLLLFFLDINEDEQGKEILSHLLLPLANPHFQWFRR